MNRFKNNKKFIYIISPNTIKNDSFYKDLELIFKTRKVAYFQLRLKKDKESRLIHIGKKIKKMVKCTRVSKGKRTARIYHRRKCRKNERRI